MKPKYILLVGIVLLLLVMVCGVNAYTYTVQQNSTYTYATNSGGAVVSTSLISAGTDNVPIQYVLNALYGTGGGSIFISNGTYLVHSDLYTGSNNTILLGNGTSTVLKSDSTLSTALIKVQGYSNFTISSISFNGNKTLNSVAADLVYVRDQRNATILNCNFTDVDIAVDIIQYGTEITNNVSVVGSSFQNCGNGSVKTAITTRQIGSVGISNINISNNYFTTASIGATYNSGDVFLKNTNNAVVSYNTFVNSITHSVMLRISDTNITISNNTFLNCRAPVDTDGVIHLSGVLFGSVTGNVLTWTSNPSTQTVPILIGTNGGNYNITIDSNTINGGGFSNIYSGIYSHGDTDIPDPTANYHIIISNNNISNLSQAVRPSSDGITITYSSDVSALNNIISNTQNGIQLASSSNCLVKGNYISSTAGFNLSSGNAATTLNTIIENNITSVTDTNKKIALGLNGANTINCNIGLWDINGTDVSCPFPLTAADFSVTPRSGTSPLSVSFTDTSTVFPTNWSWDFGDGGTSTTQNPVHTYLTIGQYNVSLRSTNAKGSDYENKSGYVSSIAPPPVPCQNSAIGNAITLFGVVLLAFAVLLILVAFGGITNAGRGGNETLGFLIAGVVIFIVGAILVVLSLVVISPIIAATGC